MYQNNNSSSSSKPIIKIEISDQLQSNATKISPALDNSSATEPASSSANLEARSGGNDQQQKMDAVVPPPASISQHNAKKVRFVKESPKIMSPTSTATHTGHNAKKLSVTVLMPRPRASLGTAAAMPLHQQQKMPQQERAVPAGGDWEGTGAQQQTTTAFCFVPLKRNSGGGTSQSKSNTISDQHNNSSSGSKDGQQRPPSAPPKQLLLASPPPPLLGQSGGGTSHATTTAATTTTAPASTTPAATTTTVTVGAVTATSTTTAPPTKATLAAMLTACRGVRRNLKQLQQVRTPPQQRQRNVWPKFSPKSHAPQYVIRAQSSTIKFKHHQQQYSSSSSASSASSSSLLYKQQQPLLEQQQQNEVTSAAHSSGSQLDDYHKTTTVPAPTVTLATAKDDDFNRRGITTASTTVLSPLNLAEEKDDFNRMTTVSLPKLSAAAPSPVAPYTVMCTPQPHQRHRQSAPFSSCTVSSSAVTTTTATVLRRPSLFSSAALPSYVLEAAPLPTALSAAIPIAEDDNGTTIAAATVDGTGPRRSQRKSTNGVVVSAAVAGLSTTPGSPSFAVSAAPKKANESGQAINLRQLRSHADIEVDDEEEEKKNRRPDGRRRKVPKVPHRCDKCPMEFPKLWNFKRHYSTHSDFKQFKCELCPHRTHQKDNLERHMSIHRYGEECRFCGATIVPQWFKHHEKTCGSAGARRPLPQVPTTTLPSSSTPTCTAAAAAVTQDGMRVQMERQHNQRVQHQQQHPINNSGSGAMSPPVPVTTERMRVVVVRRMESSGAGGGGCGGGGGLGLSIAGGIESTPFVDDDPGLFISKLVPGGAAERAGIRIGDKVLDINGTPMVGQRHHVAVQCIQHSSDVVELLLERRKTAVGGTDEPKCHPFSSSSSVMAAPSALMPSSSSSASAFIGTASSPSSFHAAGANAGAADGGNGTLRRHQSPPPPAHPPPALPPPLIHHQRAQQIRTAPTASAASSSSSLNPHHHHFGGGVHPSSSIITTNISGPQIQNKQCQNVSPPQALLVAELPFGDSQLDGTVEEVPLVRDAHNSLGLSIVGGIDHCSHPFGTPANPGVFISRIASNSPADLTRRLRIGDRILKVCSRDISGARHTDAVEALKATGRALTITVRHERQPDGLRVVVVPRRDTHPLGLSICGGIGSTSMNPQDRTDEGIFIERVERGGPGEQCVVSHGIGKPLTVGTRVLEVNDESLLGCTKEEAAHIFRSARPGPVRLLVCDGFGGGGTPSVPSTAGCGCVGTARTEQAQQRHNIPFMTGSPNASSSPLSMMPQPPLSSASSVGATISGCSPAAQPPPPLHPPQSVGLPLLPALAAPSSSSAIGIDSGVKNGCQSKHHSSGKRQIINGSGATTGAKNNNNAMYQNIAVGTVGGDQNAVEASSSSTMMAPKNESIGKTVVERQMSASVSLLDVGKQSVEEQKKQFEVTTFSSVSSSHNQHNQLPNGTIGNNHNNNGANGRIDDDDFGTEHKKVASFGGSPPPVAPKPKTNFTSFAVNAAPHNHKQNGNSGGCTDTTTTTAMMNGGVATITDGTAPETTIGDFSSRLRLFQQQTQQHQQQQPIMPNRTTSSTSLQQMAGAAQPTAAAAAVLPKLKRPLLSSDDLAKLAEDDQMRTKAAEAAAGDGRRRAAASLGAAAGSSGDASSGGEQPFPSPPPPIAAAAGGGAKTTTLMLSPMSPVVDGGTFEHLLNDSPVPLGPSSIGSIRTKKAENRFLQQQQNSANNATVVPTSTSSPAPAAISQLVLEQQRRQEWRQARMASLEAESRRVNQLFSDVHETATMGSGAGGGAVQQRHSPAENFNVK